MSDKKFVWAVFLALLFGTAGNLQAALVRGRVLNGSQENRPVRNCPVKLLRFSGHTFEQTVLDSTHTDAAGRYAFRRVRPDSASIFLVAAEHLDVSYFGRMFHVTSEDTTISLDITVYDTTHTAPQVHVQMHHVFVEPDTADYLIREVLVLHSAAQRTYVAPEQAFTLELSVPPGAYAFRPEAGLDASALHFEAHVLGTHQPLTPGAHQVAYTYRLAADGGKLRYTRPLNYPTTVFGFFVSDLQAKIESPVLQRQENFAIRGRQYARLAADNLAPGTNIEVTISRGGLLTSPALRWAIPLLLAIAVLVVVIFLVRYPRVKESQKRSANPDVQRREQLLYEIAELDEAFESGKIPKAEYEQKRKALKNEVLRLTQKLRSSGGISD